MICSEFDPITASCAPACCVCSRTLDCAKDLYACLTPEEQEQYIARLRGQRKESAAPDATNIQSGRVEKGLPTHFSTSSLPKNKEENK